MSTKHSSSSSSRQISISNEWDWRTTALSSRLDNDSKMCYYLNALEKQYGQQQDPCSRRHGRKGMHWVQRLQTHGDMPSVVVLVQTAVKHLLQQAVVMSHKQLQLQLMCKCSNSRADLQGWLGTPYMSSLASLGAILRTYCVVHAI
jgi:hypothetical protein